MHHFSKKDQNPTFSLALTALNEFWDLSKPIIFLRKTTMSFKQYDLWKDLDYKIMDDPFEDLHDLKRAQKYIDTVYETLLLKLSACLNKIHHTDYATQFWRIVIGPWLYIYISVLYDRYMSIKKTIAQYPDIDIIALSEESYSIAFNLINYHHRLTTDVYNLQLYSKILNYLKINFKKKPCNQPDITHSKNWAMRLKKKILLTGKKLYNCMMKIILNQHSVLLINDGHIPFKTMCSFFFHSKSKIVPYFLDEYENTLFDINHNLRSLLRDINFNASEFEKLLIFLLPSEIPGAYIEQFSIIRKAALQKYPTKIKAVVVINAWSFLETFKFWMADVAVHDAILIGGQHGGNYGVDAYFPSENHELKIFDKYITWGWQRKTDKPGQLVPLSVSKMLGINIHHGVAKNQNLLWLMTCRVRFREDFVFGSADYFLNYLEWHRSFYKALSPRVHSELLVRTHASDAGWDIKERLLSFAPDMHFKGETKIPFYDALRQCKLFICDNLNTTYLEALALNVPTILFWSPDSIELRSEAVPYFNKLVEAGILHYSPAAAAKMVNEIVDDVDSWWHDPMRQNARKYFCDQYGRNDPDSFQQWLDFLTSI